VHGRGRLDKIYRAKAAATLADDSRHLREHAGTIRDLEAEDETERGAQDSARLRIGHACQRTRLTHAALSRDAQGADLIW